MRLGPPLPLLYFATKERIHPGSGSWKKAVGSVSENIDTCLPADRWGRVCYRSRRWVSSKRRGRSAPSGRPTCAVWNSEWCGCRGCRRGRSWNPRGRTPWADPTGPPQLKPPPILCWQGRRALSTVLSCWRSRGCGDPTSAQSCPAIRWWTWLRPTCTGRGRDLIEQQQIVTIPDCGFLFRIWGWSKRQVGAVSWVIGSIPVDRFNLVRFDGIGSNDLKPRFGARQFQVRIGPESGQNRVKIGSESSQNRVRIESESGQNRVKIIFRPIFGSFLGQIWVTLESHSSHFKVILKSFLGHF